MITPYPPNWPPNHPTPTQTDCPNFDNHICKLATELAQQTCPVVSEQCDFCTNKCIQSQSLNRMTVTLAYSYALEPLKAEIYKKYNDYLINKPTPISPREWPKWALLISKRRKPEDIGVGATVRRIADKWGGKQFKRIAIILGIPCGCSSREKEWNRLYPYDTL